MKPPPIPQNSLDDLIAAALHGDLTPEEHTQFESRLQTDPNAQAAYQEAQAMHDLLEQTNRSAQPDPDFEQRMVSGVRRKIANPPHQETAWESLLVLWKAITGVGKFVLRIRWKEAVGICVIIAFLTAVALGPITNGTKQARQMAQMEQSKELQSQVDDLKSKDAGSADLKKTIQNQGINYVETAQKGMTLSGYIDYGKALETPAASGPALASAADSEQFKFPQGQDAQTTPQGGTVKGTPFTVPSQVQNEDASEQKSADVAVTASPVAAPPPAATFAVPTVDEPVDRNAVSDSSGKLGEVPQTKLAFSIGGQRRETQHHFTSGQARYKPRRRSLPPTRASSSATRSSISR